MYGFIIYDNQVFILPRFLWAPGFFRLSMSQVRVRFRHSFFACCAQNEFMQIEFLINCTSAFLFAHTSAINKSGLMAFFTRFVQAVHKTNLGLEFEIPFFVLRTKRI